MTSVDGYGRGSIITPEAVVLDFELAGLASRSIAYAIDFAAQLAMLLAFFWILGTAGAAGLGGSVTGIIVLLVGLISIVLGYPIAMETFNGGRTLGRMVVSSRVVTVEGAPVRFRHAFIRALLGVLDLLATAGAVAVVSTLLTRRGQRLGDLVAGTMVIREPRGKHYSGAVFFWAPSYLANWSKTIDVAPLGNDVYQMIRDFLTRSDLAEPTRHEVALDLAALVEQRLPHAPRGSAVPPEDYLTAIAAATQGETVLPRAPGATAMGNGAMPPPPARPGRGSPPPPSRSGRSTPARAQPPPPAHPAAAFRSPKVAPPPPTPLPAPAQPAVPTSSGSGFATPG